MAIAKKKAKKKTSTSKGLTAAEAKRIVAKLSPKEKERLQVYW